MKKIVTLVLFLPFVFHAQEKETKEIKEVVFQRERRKETDLTKQNLSVQQAREVASISGGIEGIIKTLPSVNSNTELSSQYMVRGGSYDENLVYINDIEIYRPFLIRNSQQEGLSVINPDMVSNISFSPGGFEAKYGDKMSSALNLYYREPRRNEILGEVSLVGGRLTFGGKTKNNRLTALFSTRYRNTNLLLKTLNEETDFNPQYLDIQSYLNYHLNPKWNFSFIGYFSNNQYQMIPKIKTVDFGTLKHPLTLSVFYGGEERDAYRNMMGIFSVYFKPNSDWKISLNTFIYRNREKEYYTITSGYELKTFDMETGAPITSYDVSGQMNHARNDLLVKTYGSQLRVQYAQNVNTNYEVGLKYERESLKDHTNEWQLVDSLGYSVPRNQVLIGQLDDSDLKLNYHIKGNNQIEPFRISAYAQYSKKFFLENHKIFFNTGVRGQKWSFNQELIISPRFQIAIKPDWKQDLLFRLAGGVYYQSPFYKEIKGLDGAFNSEIKSQKSLQIVLGNDYEFQWKQRPFKLTTELYYKKMSRLIPYYMDNIRLRYSGKNNATGIAYGIDMRLIGEFVPGVDSWISTSYARAFENIEGKGLISRPTDQRFRLALFYQDYMPQFPSMKVNLTLFYGSGLPNGASIFSDPYLYQKRLPPYKRIDIGLTKVFIDEDKYKAYSPFWRNFKELSLGVQVFNAFNIRNTIANQWITDVATDYIYPVPIRLTGRFFNVKVEFKF